MFTLVITNPVYRTTIRKDYKIERNAMKAYERAIQNEDNYVILYEQPTAYGIHGRTVRSNWI